MQAGTTRRWIWFGEASCTRPDAITAIPGLVDPRAVDAPQPPGGHPRSSPMARLGNDRPTKLHFSKPGQLVPSCTGSGPQPPDTVAKDQAIQTRARWVALNASG